MQTIQQSAIKGPLAEAAATLFAWGSTWPLAETVALPGIWQGYLNAISGVAGGTVTATGKAKMPPVAKLNQRHVVVLFSGGKDSLAAALKLRADGLSPVLLHIRGINGSAYAHEAQAARDVAAACGMPLREVLVKLAGKSAHVENPTKNLVLALLGAGAAVMWGAGSVALGMLKADTHAQNIRCGISDNVALALPGFAAIEATVPGLRMIPAPLPNDCESFRRVLSDCPEALPLLSSCMGGQRFKKSLSEGNASRFGVRLLPGRCGSCYKCALEQIVLAAIEGEVLPAPWAKHCVEKLQRGAQIVTGTTASPTPEEAFKVFLSDAVPWRRALGLPYRS
jgi:hypothetical protein